MGSERLPRTSASPSAGRRAAVIDLSLMALTWLPPRGIPPAPGPRLTLFGTNVMSSDSYRPWAMMQAGHLPIKPGPARIAESRQGNLAPDGWKLFLDQADHPVVVAATAVDDAEAVALAVMEQVEVVTDEFHFEQGLIDRHRARRVHLLAQDQRAVTLHLDGDQAALRVSPVLAVHGGGDRRRGGGRGGGRVRRRGSHHGFLGGQ